MPRFDKTGPEGKGPKTGRQMGDCDGANSFGRGIGPCGREFRERRMRFRNLDKSTDQPKE